MIIRPYGLAIWERIQAQIDMRIKVAGAQNVYLPLFILESYLRKVNAATCSTSVASV